MRRKKKVKIKKEVERLKKKEIPNVRISKESKKQEKIRI